MTFPNAENRGVDQVVAPILERTGGHCCLAAEAVGQQNSRYVLVWNPGFDNDIQRTRLAGDFVGSFLMQRKSVPTNPFEESHHALSIASASVGLVGY
jgi:hypothetical protein